MTDLLSAYGAVSCHSIVIFKTYQGQETETKKEQYDSDDLQKNLQTAMHIFLTLPNEELVYLSNDYVHTLFHLNFLA